MVNAYLVYGLVDPRSGELRYVGKTSRPLEARVKQHLYAAVTEEKTHKAAWLRQLLASGLKPEAEVLEVHETAAALDEAERHFIAYFRGIGCRLTNATDGGEGLANPSPETRQKMSRVHRGKVISPRHRERVSAAHRGKRLSQEHRAKLVVAALNRSPDHRRHLAAAASCQVITDEHRVANSRGHGGRPFMDQNGTVYQTQNGAARNLGLSVGNVNSVLRGLRHQTRGYTFRYVE